MTAYVCLKNIEDEPNIVKIFTDETKACHYKQVNPGVWIEVVEVEQ